MRQGNLNRLANRLGTIWRSKSAGYWLTAFVILCASIYFAPSVNRRLGMDTLRYRIFQYTGALTARPLRARYTQVVVINQDDYIRGSSGASPVNRGYIAKIVNALNNTEVQIIALDFILHFADQRTGPVRVGDYSAVGNVREVNALVTAIIAAANNNKKIVLPIDILPDADEASSSYFVVPAIYQAYGLCTKLKGDGVWDNSGAPGFELSPRARQNINCGYIELPFDMRQVPPLIDVHQGYRIASLALAIAEAKDAQAAAMVGDKIRFVTYLPTSKKEPLSAGKLLRGDENIFDTQRPTAVIVGGAFLMHDGSGTVDMHEAVPGKINGVLIHENFAEGILDARLVTPIPEWVLVSIEAILGVAFAFLFAAFPSFWAKLLLLTGSAAALLLVQWLLFALFGSFLEAFWPLLGLSLHSILEKLLE